MLKAECVGDRVCKTSFDMPIVVTFVSKCHVMPYNMSLRMRKQTIWVSDQVRHKPG